jgi:uncharacterized UPF0160 family protein
VREITIARSRIDAQSLVKKFYDQAEDKRVIFLDQYVPWSEVITSYPEPLFVISKSMDGDSFVMQTVRDPDQKFINRKDMPVSWAGLRNEALAKVTGVPDATFCHKGLWIATAKTKEGIMELAKLALLM